MPNFPDDIIYSFCQYLSLKDICNLHLSNKKFSKVRTYIEICVKYIPTSDKLDKLVDDINKLKNIFLKAKFEISVCSLNFFDTNELIALTKIIKENNSIQTLSISDNRVNLPGWTALIDALKANTTSLKNFTSKFTRIPTLAVIQIAEELKINNTLQKLDLSYNMIEQDGMLSLINALKVNTSLISLNLTGNQIFKEEICYAIGDKGAIALADALKVNTSLQTLEIYQNDIKDDGIIAIADALTENSTLHTLDISNSNISSTGFKHMINMLKINNTLINLDIGSNYTHNEQMGSIIAKVLEVNNSLTTLVLNDCGLEYCDIINILTALKGNTTLHTINLSNNIKVMNTDILKELLKELFKVTNTIKKLNLHADNYGTPLLEINKRHALQLELKEINPNIEINL
jgi:23S rRNA pseudoU1915 N3-methylase RlmH